MCVWLCRVGRPHALLRYSVLASQYRVSTHINDVIWTMAATTATRRLTQARAVRWGWSAWTARQAASGPSTLRGPRPSPPSGPAHSCVRARRHLPRATAGRPESKTGGRSLRAASYELSGGLSVVPEHAPGCPKLRPAPANQPLGPQQCWPGRPRRPWFRPRGGPRRQRCRSGTPRRTSRDGASRSESSSGAAPLSRSDARLPQPAALHRILGRIPGRRAAPERAPTFETRQHRPRPAGSPGGCFRRQSVPEAAASLGRPRPISRLSCTNAGRPHQACCDLCEHPTKPQPQPL